VAVIHNGQMIYRRGFGHADVDDGKVAHAETVYNMASVAKVIGGTLAGKLEAERRLRDGTTFFFDMTLPTKHYLSNFKSSSGPFSIPAHHTHNVDHLLSHLACVGHYDTNPPIPNQTTHRATALAAVRSIWNIGLVQTGPDVPLGPCYIESSFPSYSTPAFTFVAAILERRTGRTVSRLLREEIAIPYGLPSLRAQYETPTLPANYERATPYSNTNLETVYEDNSWKILSGGMESNVVDLANFGWKVLSGQIVSPAVRDDRVFAPVGVLCFDPMSVEGHCAYGLGWARGYDQGRRIVAHGGSWNGAGSFILMYRDQGLVIAIMSNRRGHDPSRLALAIGCVVLAANYSGCPSPP
jgi:CubicO group peptidase (beta-lactamase class C family)